MLQQIAYEFNVFILNIQHHMELLLQCLAGLWLINLVNWAVGRPLHRFGLVPRRLYGLPGIIISPIVHGSFNHLFFNSIPLFVLSLFLVSYGIITFLWITGCIIVLSGVLLWLFGRRGNHIGASDLISGYFSYLIAGAYAAPSVTSIFIAVILLYYFGGIILSLIPSEETTSWESHIFGFMAGMATFFYLM